ncbi:MAG: hypothetical protein CMD81_14695 [Gammaproteobacteria bacterium]|nr:hypothetical protein [Gammaproteobacteria bacterium]MBK85067.1 hypothetical protein [Gammaproteobacteria bacterium]|tara:strand:- start:1013 stop:1366 length:354 start_codon:yes stop_codon:yes gene_type:complete
MIFDEPKGKVWLYTSPTDMRKSYHGLSGLVRNEMNLDELNGDYFVFVNKKKTQLKMLYFERTGFCLWGKRLEQGQFPLQGIAEGSRQLSWTDLKLFLEGIKVEKARYSKRWRYSQND